VEIRERKEGRGVLAVVVRQLGKEREGSEGVLVSDRRGHLDEIVR
jgi:hypothetical protein